MLRDPKAEQLIELKDEISYAEGVCFDPEAVTIEGKYLDELSAHRAKKGWVETLEVNFLLDPAYDVIFKVANAAEATQYILRCEFVSACARYAFWRLTNNQAPEAQYQIETAHIPDCKSRHLEFLTAPDMRSVFEEPMVLRGDGALRPRSGLSRIGSLLRRIFR